MVNTLHQALHPLFFVCFFMGLGFYPRKRSMIQWISYILYSLTIWFAYTYLLLYMFFHFTRKVLFESIAAEIMEESNFLLSILSAIMSFYYQKRFEISIKKLAAVDNTLEKLGTIKTYKKLHIKTKQIIIGWLAYSLAMNFYDTIWWMSLKETTSWGLYMAHIVNYCIHITAFMDMLFTFFLWYIGTRFDKVNEHMRWLLIKDHELRCTWKNPKVALHRYALCTDYMQTLWTSMHLHLELCRLARELNSIFAVQMTFEMASYLLYLTSLFYYVYWMLIQPEKMYSMYDWLSIILWIHTFLIRIYIVNYICENVTIKANKIGKLFHQLTYIHRYADFSKEIYQFTLQTMQHPLKFTGMSLFYFGYGFLRKFCMALVMYLVIMVQFNVHIAY